MTVPLLMGWVLLALLVLLLVFLMVVTLISGRSGSSVEVGSSPGQAVPVNVFQRGATAPGPVLSVPGQQSAPAGQSGPFRRSVAPPQSAAGLRRWQPGLGAAPVPMDVPSPVDA